MAAATTTISELQQLGGWPWGVGLSAVWARVDVDGDYTAGGVPLNKAVLGFRHLHGMFVPGHDGSTDADNRVRVNGTPTSWGNTYGYNVALANSAESPKVFLQVGGIANGEETNGTDVTGYFFYAIFVGEV